MAKVCPPGVICIENMTIIFLLIVLGLAIFVYYKFFQETNSKQDVVVVNSERNLLYPKMHSMLSNMPSNILMNPFVPPMKNGNYFPKDSSDPRGIPININTRGFDSAYKQVGILTRTIQRQDNEVILPVMGRPLYSNRNKWQYYTMNDKSNAIKLPMSYNGRSCTSEYGCNELTSGDTVYVEGYNDAFKVTIYENSSLRYIPYL
tara:strand:+ start:2100 stop:2711 length:612 start_codon:yes stop_codon:yes gene_type:complete